MAETTQTIAIVNIYGRTLFSVEAADARDALQKAIASGADLRSAILRSANLRSADLSGADLSGADLRSANLSGADLSDANLRSANLRSADLSDANLRSADLRSAILSDANLRSAILSGAILSGANLRSADLRRATGLNPWRTNSLLILLDQPGAIRAYKLVNTKLEGPFNGGIRYDMGADLSVADANTDPLVDCAAGINLATLDWCMKEWREGYRILIAEFTAADIAAIPHASDGKFRVHRCKVVGEKDLAEIGLVEAVVPA